MKLRASALAFVILAATAPCTSEPDIRVSTLKGNDLLRACKSVVRWADAKSRDSDTAVETMKCIFYLDGVTDAVSALQGTKALPPLFCIPADATNEQEARILVKYLEERPADLHLEAVVLTLEAFNDAFPCHKR